MSRSRKLARREFIKTSAKVFGGLGMTSLVADLLMGQILNKAIAQSKPENFYIHLSLPGGPPRWYFDQPLNPSGRAADFIAGGFGNQLEKKPDGVAQSIHATYAHKLDNKVIHLPPVWEMNRNGYNNSDLLKHMQMFRGVDMQINNHAISNSRQVAPVLGGLSIGGILADASQFPIPGAFAGAPAGNSFKSEKGTAAIPLGLDGKTNPIEILLRPFRQPKASSLKDPNWEKVIGSSLEQFETYSANIGIRPIVLTDAYGQSMELIKSDKFSIKERWPATLAKYQAALSEALNRERINQIFNFPVKADGTAQFNIDRGNVRLTDSDLRGIFADASMTAVACAFAISEILITERITSNITFGLNPPTGLKSQGKAIEIPHDQHFVGSALSTISTTVFYRGIINCLHDLVRELQKADQFNNTVIHIGSEFSRTPKSDASGSDHGFYGSSASIISGKISEFGLIGHVYKDGKLNGSGTYPGTWGRAADFPGLDGRPIWAQDIANTICAMLGLSKTVSDNGVTLLNGSNSWKPTRNSVDNV